MQEKKAGAIYHAGCDYSSIGKYIECNLKTFAIDFLFEINVLFVCRNILFNATSTLLLKHSSTSDDITTVKTALTRSFEMCEKIAVEEVKDR